MGKEFDKFMWETFGKKRKPIELKRQKLSEIKDRVVESMLNDMNMEAEIVWILQGDWHTKGINPTRILDKEKGTWK